jgi:hypothetical protein
MASSNGITNGHAPPSNEDLVRPKYSADTRAIHADDYVNSYADVAPALHVSTTFRYSQDADKLDPVDDEKVNNMLQTFCCHVRKKEMLKQVSG